VAEDDASMRAWAEELVARARSEGVELTGDNGLLTALVRRVLQTGLEVETGEAFESSSAIAARVWPGWQ
jgi:hypothetical protein